MLIDTDVHPSPKDFQSILKYMSASNRRHFEIKGPMGGGLPYRFQHPTGSTTRIDAIGPNGGPAGSDPEFVRADLLERYGITHAILNSGEATSFASTNATTDEGVTLASAFNDYFIENWLPVDRRYYYALAVSSQDPAAAVREIKRHQSTPGVVAINMRSGTIPFGNRFFWPIYEAAEEAGLPIYVHTGAGEMVFQGAYGNGMWSDNYTDRFMSLPSIASFIVISLIVNGVFEQFKGLKFSLIEYGVPWLLSTMLRMDTAWKGLRIESPWIKEPPSEYIRRHMKVSTQPLDDMRSPDKFASLVDLIGDELLMFSTDYPHWDEDSPDFVLRALPKDTRERIFGTNAWQFFSAARLSREG